MGVWESGKSPLSEMIKNLKTFCTLRPIQGDGEYILCFFWCWREGLVLWTRLLSFTLLCQDFLFHNLYSGLKLRKERGVGRDGYRTQLWSKEYEEGNMVHGMAQSFVVKGKWWGKWVKDEGVEGWRSLSEDKLNSSVILPCDVLHVFDCWFHVFPPPSSTFTESRLCCLLERLMLNPPPWPHLALRPTKSQIVTGNKRTNIIYISFY